MTRAAHNYPRPLRENCMVSRNYPVIMPAARDDHVNGARFDWRAVVVCWLVRALYLQI
jgi:hypothetical protein